MTTRWEAPGSKQWMGTLYGLGPDTDYENYLNGGIVRFDDGTVWLCFTEARSGTGVFTYGVSIFERTPSSKAWELLTADGWTSPLNEANNNTPSSGKMNEWQFGYHSDYFFVSDGDDSVYMLSPGDTDEAWQVVVFHRSARTFNHYAPYTDTPDNRPQSFPQIYEDYIWWLNVDHDLYRMRLDNMAIELHRSFTKPASLGQIDPATSLPYGLGNDTIGAAAICFYDGWMYALSSHGSNCAYSDDEYCYAAIRRTRPGGGDIETLYQYVSPITTRGFRYPDLDDRERYEGPAFLLGTGLQPLDWIRSEVRDDWLYWVDFANGYASDGMTFSRIYIPALIENMPIIHDPYNPTFEILNNGSAVSEHGGCRAGPWTGGLWHIWWREGDRPLSGTTDAAWFFDDDGSIVFTHENFLYIQRRSLSLGGIVTRIISRLSPPSASKANVVLKFTGNELKGYSNVREVKSISNPEKVELR